MYVTKFAETAPQKERIEAMTTWAKGIKGIAATNYKREGLYINSQIGGMAFIKVIMILTVLMSKNVTTATVEPALATMEPIHRERMNCNINQIQKCQSNAAMQ